MINQARRSTRHERAAATATWLAPGPVSPRQFLSVSRRTIPRSCTARAVWELGEKILSDGAPLAARVIVNRVWAWHFGKRLVADAKRFRRAGREADAPRTARRSRGPIHRQRLVAEMAAPRNHAVGRVPAGEPSARRADAVDPANRLALAHESAPPRSRGVSRLHPRRLVGTLDWKPWEAFPSTSDQQGNNRRTV